MLMKFGGSPVAVFIAEHDDAVAVPTPTMNPPLNIPGTMATPWALRNRALGILLVGHRHDFVEHAGRRFDDGYFLRGRRHIRRLSILRMRHSSITKRNDGGKQNDQRNARRSSEFPLLGWFDNVVRCPVADAVRPRMARGGSIAKDRMADNANLNQRPIASAIAKLLL